MFEATKKRVELSRCTRRMNRASVRRVADICAPLLPDTLGALDCRVVATHEAGDHVIYVGRVEALRLSPEREPLLYQRGSYGAFRPE